MRVKVINALGEVMLLPEELALQGWPMEADLPGVEIEGHDGQVIDAGMIRLKPRTIRVTGTLQGLSKDDADRIREMIAGFVFRANPLRLYRHELSERYMLVYAQTIDHAYRVGRHGGRVFDLAIGLRAADPLFYGQPIVLSRNLYGDGRFGSAYYGDLPLGEWYAANRGTAPTWPRLIIMAGTVIMGLTLKNLDNGQMIAIGDLGQGDVVAINCQQRTATINGVNALHRMGNEFLVYGFRLEAQAPNHLRATTMNSTEPFVHLELDACERYY